VFCTGPGRPAMSSDAARPKRTKSNPKEMVCVFSSCSFCINDPSEPLHLVTSDNMGDSLLDVKLKTQNDHVRTCLSDLLDDGDARALEKYYHRKCLRSAQRTMIAAERSNTQLIYSLSDEQLLLCVENTLTDDDVTLNMAEVNDAYISVLKRYKVDISETANYCKHLKQLNVFLLSSLSNHYVKMSPKNLFSKHQLAKPWNFDL